MFRKPVYIFLLLLLPGPAVLLHAQNQKYILDADTGNEMDDLYAVAYMLGMDNGNLISINAAHFNNVDLLTDSIWNSYPTKNINTLQISFDLNKDILTYTGRDDVRCLKGAHKIIGRAWGGNEPRPSEASKVIIEEAMKMKDGERLVVFTLGPVTNVASAIIEKPEIENKIVLYMMGANYYPDKNAWSKSEFNIRNDLNAFDYLLNSSVEMHIMPASTCWKFKFKKEETINKLSSGSELDRLLAKRWAEVNAGNEWIMWDLAMLIAYFKPEMATEKEVMAPPENTQRKVFVYTDLDAEKMEQHFWDVYKKTFQ